MKKTLLLILLFATTFYGERAFAQFITFSEIDTTTFPKLWTSFTARNEQDEPYFNLKTSDFTIVDNGVVVPESRKELVCENPPANVVLCIDRSTSMDDPINGIHKWEWVKAGVQDFVRNMQMSDASKTSLVAFGNEVLLRCPWTKNKDEVIDSMEKTTLYGATNFNSPFLDPNGAIAQFKKVDPQYRRIIVFLTDGDHDYNSFPIIYQDSIIKLLLEANIQLYAIQLVNPMNSALADIVQKTGGRAYVVYSMEDLRSKYTQIAYDSKANYMCYLKWTTDYICMESDAQHTAKIYFSKLAQFEAVRKYRIPWSGRAIIEPYDTTYIFDDPEPGEYVDRTIRLTGRHTDQTIKKITISPSQYFQIINWSGPGSPGNTNIPLPPDQSFYVTVRFTQQGSKGLRQAMLQVDADPCDIDIPLKGGYPEIVVTNPKKDDIFTDCQEIDVRWENVDPKVGINLDFSTDQGASWTRFATDVKGLSYKWKPGFTANSLRIRAEVGDNPSLRFINVYGSPKDEYTTGLAINRIGNYIYAAGNFTDALKLGNVDLKPYGSRDMFLVKENSDGGVLWATSFGSALADSCAGVVVDAEGNIFTLAIGYKNTNYDSFIANQNAIDGKSSILVAKHTPAGGLLNVLDVSARGMYTDFRVRNLKLGINQFSYTEPIIYVEGEYTGNLIWIPPSIGFMNKDTSSWHPFTMVLNRDLGVDTIYSEFEGKSYAKYNYSTMTAVDRDYNRYETGNFSGQTNVYGNDLNSRGANDFYITKNGLHPKSLFVTGDFSIDHPFITFGTKDMTLGDCLLGDTCTIVLPLKLKNTSNAPVKINRIQFAQNEYNSYLIDSTMLGVVIPARDSVAFSVKFNPTNSIYLSAQLIVGTDCSTDALVNLHALGRCEIEIVRNVDVGKVFVNDSDGVRVDCLIKNNNKIPITVRLSKIGSNPNDFLIAPTPDVARIIPPGECAMYDISFLPVYLGPRSFTIQYTMTPNCGSVYTDVVGEGIEDGIHVDLRDVVWNSPRRVRSNNDSVAILQNKGNLDANITSIRFENTNGDVFIGKLPETPFVLKSKTKLEIPVTFAPEMEGEAIGALVVDYDGMPEQLRATLKGEGWLPELALSWDCGEDIKPGETTTSKLYVANTAKFSTLKVDRIDLDQSNGEFTWASGAAPAGFEIPPDTTFEYDILFAPQTSQMHSSKLKVYTDNYDATFVGDWKETPFVGGCGEMNLTFTNPITAPAAIICGNSETPVEISNLSGESDLVLYAAKSSIEGVDSDAFNVIGLTDDVIVPPNSKVTLKIAFAPRRPGLHQATLNVGNSFNIPIMISLSGESEKIPLTAEKRIYQTSPGEDNTLSVRAKIPALGSGTLDSMIIILETNYGSIALIKGSIKNSAPGINWKEPYFLNNVWRVEGHGSLAVPYDGELFKVNFLTLLDTANSVTINGYVDYGCAVSADELSTVQISEVCFQKGRLIDIPGKPFDINVNQNLKGELLEVSYNLAYDCNVDLKLYNSMGLEVLSLESGPKSIGGHRVARDMSLIPSGVYWLRIIGGPFEKTLRLDIVK